MLKKKELRNKVIIIISLQPNVADLKIFQTVYSIRSNNLSLKYQRFPPSGCKN